MLVNLPPEKFSKDARDFSAQLRKHYGRVVDQPMIPAGHSTFEQYLTDRILKGRGDQWIDRLELNVVSRACEVLGLRIATARPMRTFRTFNLQTGFRHASKRLEEKCKMGCGPITSVSSDVRPRETLNRAGSELSNCGPCRHRPVHRESNHELSRCQDPSHL